MTKTNEEMRNETDDAEITPFVASLRYSPRLIALGKGCFVDGFVEVWDEGLFVVSSCAKMFVESLET